MIDLNAYKPTLSRSVQNFNLESPLPVMPREVEAQGETERVNFYNK